MFDVSWHYLVAVSVSSSTSPDIYFVCVSSRGFFHSFGSFIDALLPRCVFVFVAFLCTLNAWMSFWCVRELVVHSIVISVHRSPAWRMFLRGVFVAVAFLIPSSLFFFILLSPVTFTSLSSLCLCLLYDVLFWINFYFRCISGSAIKLGWKGAFVIPTRRARENTETT